MAGLVPAIHVLLYWFHHARPADRLYPVRFSYEPPFGGGRASTFFRFFRAERTLVRMKGGWVYILTNRPNGTLYVGVTADLARRLEQHREGTVEGFSKRYGLKQLVYAEHHDEITNAIQREKSLKHWSLAKKVWLILERNPAWRDLYDELPL